ncbi:MAG: hypothetical protein Q7S66_00140 [bacterium]|nr:hypothetical protein [bacterium]
MFEMGYIPDDKSRGWTVRIDGAECRVGVIKITSQYGTLEYGLLVPFGELELDGEVWKFKDTAASVGLKRPDDVRFFDWREAIRQTQDGIARAAIAQLLTKAL